MLIIRPTHRPLCSSTLLQKLERSVYRVSVYCDSLLLLSPMPFGGGWGRHRCSSSPGQCPCLPHTDGGQIRAASPHHLLSIYKRCSTHPYVISAAQCTALRLLDGCRLVVLFTHCLHSRGKRVYKTSRGTWVLSIGGYMNLHAQAQRAADRGGLFTQAMRQFQRQARPCATHGD